MPADDPSLWKFSWRNRHLYHAIFIFIAAYVLLVHGKAPREQGTQDLKKKVLK